MKIILCNVPIRNSADTFPPVGITRLIDSLYSKGYCNVSFYNIDLIRPTTEEIIQFFRVEKPDIVGISAVVSTSYKFVKWLSYKLKEVLPEVKIILGGNMAVSAEVILKKCPIDLCVLGEGEKTIVSICDHFKKNSGLVVNEELLQVKGLAFYDKRNNPVFTGFADPIPPEEISQPNYNLLDDFYLTDYKDRSSFLDDYRSRTQHRQGKKVAYVDLSKGCVSRCTFCHRWNKGYRQIPVDKVIKHIEYLIKEFNVGFLVIGDENFGADKKYLNEFLERIRPLDLLWHVGGMRVKSVDLDLFRKMKACGCVSVYFGMESGSDTMLKIMEKGATLEDNYRAINAIKETGMSTIIQLVIAMPGENNQTIKETVQFVRKAGEILGSGVTSVNYALAFPGTPLYEYARYQGFVGPTIADEEEYLLKISDTEAGARTHILEMNMTEEKISDVISWKYLIDREANQEFRNSRFRDRLVLFVQTVAGESFALFFVKLFLCYKATGSIMSAVRLLRKSASPPPYKTPIQSLRRTLRDLNDIDGNTATSLLDGLRESR